MIGTQFDSTLWSGSAFDCASNEITLQHSLYTDNNTLSARAYGECNKGSIVAQILGIRNINIYVSQLNVTVSDRVIGKTIECFYDNINITAVKVGEKTLRIAGI